MHTENIDLTFSVQI